MVTDPAHVLLFLARLLDGLAIRYSVGGSIASSHHGEPRATNDVDVLVDVPLGRVAALVRALQPAFQVFEDTVTDAVRAGRSFSAVHLDWLVKIDFYPAGPGLLDRNELERRRPVHLAEARDQPIWFASPEDIILRKLDGFRPSGGVLDRQLRDVTGVMKQQREALDLAYLRHFARALGLSASLEDCLRAAGMPGP